MDAFGLDTQRFNQLGEVDTRRFIAVDVAAVAGVVLAAGHAHRAVVEQQHRDVALVVHDVEQALHAHVHEGRIADHRQMRLSLSASPRPLSSPMAMPIDAPMEIVVSSAFQG